MKFPCPTCGKSRSHPASEAGLGALCTACGTAYRVPDEPEPLLATHLGPSAPQPVPLHRSDTAILIAATFLVIVAAFLVCWAGLDWHRASEAQVVARAMEMKSHAELLAAGGQPEPAREAFRDLQSYLESQRGDDPEIDRLLKELPHDEQAIDHLLAARATPPIPAPPIAVSAAPPADTPPTAHPPAPAPPTETTRPVVVASTPPSTSPGHPEPSPVPIPVKPNRPPIQPVALTHEGVTDEQIGNSITHGIDYLLTRFNHYTEILRKGINRDDTTMGQDILCVYALMQCQQATGDPRLNPHDERMKGLIDAIKTFKLEGYHYETYARGLRATALALYNRPEDQTILKQDASALMLGTYAGGYTYELPKRLPPRSEWPTADNSNSQYGLLGVWSAAEAGVGVPESYWEKVQQHWTHAQDHNGQWSYGPEPEEAGTHSMTCAGLASLYVAHDYLDMPKQATSVGRDPLTPQLAKGLAWLEQEDHSVELDHGAYDLYGLERVGLASGFKYFGAHDWYRELAALTISQQQPNGAWGDDVETAYSLLFLARGRHPILMNKLRFNGYWANRPRDLANLSRFMSHELERQLNWQIVPLSRPWTDWTDSPILYLASHKAPSLSNADYDKIRNFVENGGLLFLQDDGDSVEFQKFAYEAARRLFPAYQLADIPANHPLYSVMYRLSPNPELKAVSNGSRLLMVYSGTDLSTSWQLRDTKHSLYHFQLGGNLFVYAAGKTELRNRLVSNYIPPVKAAPTATYRVARLKYAGNWDPEPAAWQRFSRAFQLKTGYGLDVKTVAITDLKPETAPIAHLTGTARYDLPSPEVAALKTYVESGGTLLIDVCGGSGAFADSIKDLLYTKAFPNNPPHVLARLDPMLTSTDHGMEDVSRQRLRPYAVDLLGSNPPHLEIVTAGKGRVIVSYLDLTTGLLATNTWGILGYSPDYAEALVQNIVLWGIDHRQ